MFRYTHWLVIAPEGQGCDHHWLNGIIHGTMRTW